MRIVELQPLSHSVQEHFGIGCPNHRLLIFFRETVLFCCHDMDHVTVTYMGRSSPLKDGYLLYDETYERMLTSEAVIFVIKSSIVWGKLIDVHELTVCAWYWYMCVYAFMACTRWLTCVLLSAATCLYLGTCLFSWRGRGLAKRLHCTNRLECNNVG